MAPAAHHRICPLCLVTGKQPGRALLPDEELSVAVPPLPLNPDDACAVTPNPRPTAAEQLEQMRRRRVACISIAWVSLCGLLTLLASPPRECGHFVRPLGLTMDTLVLAEFVAVIIIGSLVILFSTAAFISCEDMCSEQMRVLWGTFFFLHGAFGFVLNLLAVFALVQAMANPHCLDEAETHTMHVLQAIWMAHTTELAVIAALLTVFSSL